jgi:8-oxo-dGTP diphosphatase
MHLEKPISSVENEYGNKVRVRACGICLVDNKVLLVNHQMYAGQDFWSPPGGGVHFGEKAADAVVREIAEETGLVVKVDTFLFTREFVNPPLHAIELFFRVSVTDGHILVGSDPEFTSGEQIINQVAFLTLIQLNAIPEEAKHSIFAGISSWESMLAKGGLL